MKARFSAALSLALAVSFGGRVDAQTVPDIVGIRPGMTPDQAKAALLAHNPKMAPEIGRSTWRSDVSTLPPKIDRFEASLGVRDIITVLFLPLSERVGLVERRFNFDMGKPRPNAKETIAAFHEKYGPPSATTTKPTSETMIWAFVDGKRIDVPEAEAWRCFRLATYAMRAKMWWMDQRSFKDENADAASGLCGKNLATAYVGYSNQLVEYYDTAVADIVSLTTAQADLKRRLDEMDREELDRRSKGTGVAKPKL